jgi:hypothetical protein
MVRWERGLWRVMGVVGMVLVGNGSRWLLGGCWRGGGRRGIILHVRARQPRFVLVAAVTWGLYSGDRTGDSETLLP